MTVRIFLRRDSGAPKSTAWMFAQWVFLVTGLLAISYTSFSVVARYAYQAYENREFDRALALRHVTPPSLIAKIEIPRLSISAIVKEGVDDRTLALAAGHIPSTALPGQAGNVGISAHRDTLFRNLKDVRPNDRITLTTLERQYVYRVVSFKIVNPADVSVLDPSPDEKTLTLVTCYPFYYVGNAPKRFIVRAVEVPD